MFHRTSETYRADGDCGPAVRLNHLLRLSVQCPFSTLLMYIKLPASWDIYSDVTHTSLLRCYSHVSTQMLLTRLYSFSSRERCTKTGERLCAKEHFTHKHRTHSCWNNQALPSKCTQAASKVMNLLENTLETFKTARIQPLPIRIQTQDRTDLSVSVHLIVVTNVCSLFGT